MDSNGCMQPWSDIKQGVWTLPDKTIVGNIDTDYGKIRRNAILPVEGGISVVTMNVQSLRGPVTAADKANGGRVKAWCQEMKVPGISKQSMVLKQTGQRKAHLGGMQEVRSFSTAISTQDGFLLQKQGGQKRLAWMWTCFQCANTVVQSGRRRRFRSQAGSRD